MTDAHNRAATVYGEATGRAVGEQHRGQMRIAYRLEDASSGRLLFVNRLGWLVWDGKRWALDDKGEAPNAVAAVLREALTESLGDHELRADVRKCESAGGVAGVLTIASSLPRLRASVDELDADPYLLNCANGTLDLRTRELRPHDPADKITRVTRGAYDPRADGTGWEQFLAQMLPDVELRAYLQQVMGQSAYGRVREHLFPVLTGTGANGKGTAYGAIVNAMGDYATIINPELLMTGGREGGGPEMMSLLGARLVIGSETGDGRQLDAALMKRLTGGDPITARRLYQEPVTWSPSHQLVYVTNHLPRVKGNDPALWRRLRVIPFDVVVPEGERDQKLPERLELAADAILTWLVHGWFAYDDRGSLTDPESVRRATDEYQADSDAVRRFIQAECVTGPHVHVTTRELYSAWSAWAAADGADALSERAFAKELDRLGYEARKTRIGASRAGIALRADDESG
ncbi:DNA primase family protein [Pseudarthrobacter sp. alpha12b]